MEIWREVPGYGGWYECSDQGRVRSWRCPGRNGLTESVRSDEPRVMRPACTRGGYLFVTLSSDGRTKSFRLNRLVLATFLGGPGFDDAHACHQNGNRKDNRLENLRWGTVAENQADKEGHGTQVRGERVASSKLTRESVVELRTLWASGEHTVRQLAERYGVSGPTLWKAATGKTWRDHG